VRKQTYDYMTEATPETFDREVEMPQMGPVKRPPTTVGMLPIFPSTREKSRISVGSNGGWISKQNWRQLMRS